MIDGNDTPSSNVELSIVIVMMTIIPIGKRYMTVLADRN